MQAKPTLASRRDELMNKLDSAHKAYCDAATFGGPSLYFHEQALLAAKQNDVAIFAEKVYAVLSAWGMHRMGRGGSKMCEFECFESSLKSVWSEIKTLQQAKLVELDEHSWKAIERVFRKIKCMESKTSLVGNSKVMAHAIPNLIPPVDREYTLRFLFGRTSIANDLDSEWLMLEQILRDFFYPISKTDSFMQRSQQWLSENSKCRWDTSPLKIIDNLIIGCVKLGQ
jgi:hypothetical protein